MAQPSPEFEKSFADLAYSYINQNAPKLLDFMVGFQVLEHDDDESRAVGVFGFSVGGKKKDMFYAPVFFLNGKLKGQELLYNGTSDLFMPMDEAWVDFILNKKPEMIGTSGEADDRSLLARYLPNFKDILGKGMSKAATEVDVMGPSEVHGKLLRGEAAKYASAFHTFEGLGKDTRVLKQRVKEAKASALCQVVKTHTTYKDPEFLTDSSLCYTKAQKEEFVKHSYVIVDERKDVEKSGVIDGTLSTSSPSEPGVYQIVHDDMSVQECLWLPTPSDESERYWNITKGRLVNLKTKLELGSGESTISLSPEPIATLS